jgi:protein dithiol oxidoreductase (disulfide-forming)
LKLPIVALLAAIFAAACGPAAHAQPASPPAEARFVAGQHYQVLDPAQPTRVTPGKVEVAEIFWYGCPHCYRLSPYIQAWKKTRPDAAELVQVPAVLSPRWHAHARLFYAMTALGIQEQAHEPVFREIHERRNPLADLDQMTEFLGRFGVSVEDARATLTSFAVEAEVRTADARVRGYRLTGVPAVVVNGRYVARVDTAGGFEALLDLINHLVELEASALPD